MTYDDWKTESPEDERERLHARGTRSRRGAPAYDDDSEAATADESRES